MNLILNEYSVQTQNCVDSAIWNLAAAISFILDNKEDGIDHNMLLKYLCVFWEAPNGYIFSTFHISKIPHKPSTKQIYYWIDSSIPDEWLYGKNFAEIIKEAKELEKTSSCFKPTLKQIKRHNKGNS